MTHIGAKKNVKYIGGEAEMPLTPKGYCDLDAVIGVFSRDCERGRNAPNAERLL